MVLHYKLVGSVHLVSLARPIVILCAVTISWLTPSHGYPSYQNATQIFKDKFDPSNYNTAVRPLKNQKHIMHVSVGFDIVAIVDIDEKKQKFIINGFLVVSWIDEILAWDPKNYNDITFINPFPIHIWRPRLLLGNAMEERDVFEDNYCTTTAYHNGTVEWNPGGLFPTSCNLNLRKYPFDKQYCEVDLYAMESSDLTVVLKALQEEVGMSMYSVHGEWEILKSTLKDGMYGNVPFIKVKFQLQRRPEFFIINVIMPILLLSFLNIMVFLIPVESGEKISYGITVLLALAVFMSAISEMLPRTSDILPLVTIYLCVVLFISVCTVVAAIFIISFYHHSILKNDETHGHHHQIRKTNKSIKPFSDTHPSSPMETTGPQEIPDTKMENTDHFQIPPPEGETTDHFQIPPPEGGNTDHFQIPPPKREMVSEYVDQTWLSTRRATVIDIVRNRRMRSLYEAEVHSSMGHDHHVKNRRIEYIAFVVFMTIWVAVTTGFMLAISS